MPNKFSRLSFRKSDEGAHQATTTSDGGFLSAQQLHDATYDYLDTFDDDEMKEALESAIAVELEEDEEYRVRSAVVTAIACIRAKDGLSPSAAIKFLETVLESEDAKMMGNLVCDDAQLVIEETFNKVNARIGDEVRQSDVDSGRVSTLEPLYTFVPSMLLADALLATCHISASPTTYIDPATGKPVQSKGAHPLARLLNAVQSWLEWELYRENIRLEFEKDTQCGISGNCHDVIAASAVIALSNLAIQIQSTTDPSEPDVSSPVHHASSAKFYMDIFDSEPHRNDLTRAACAQAISCVCCAADRFEKNDTEPLGLLISFEFLLGRILGKLFPSFLARKRSILNSLDHFFRHLAKTTELL